MSDRPKDRMPRARRLPVEIPISLSTVDMFLDSAIMNLSKGGVFIKADITLPLGSEVDFRFTLPDTGRVIQATGTVVWTRKSGTKSKLSFPNHPAGMGIQFKTIGVEDLEAILDTIDELVENS